MERSLCLAVLASLVGVQACHFSVSMLNVLFVYFTRNVHPECTGTEVAARRFRGSRSGEVSSSWRGRLGRLPRRGDLWPQRMRRAVQREQPYALYITETVLRFVRISELRDEVYQVQYAMRRKAEKQKQHRVKRNEFENTEELSDTKQNTAERKTLKTCMGEGEYPRRTHDEERG